ncbi:conjugal transfer protein TraF [Helicobacter sp. 10-6591]|uniref:conjugal transfer protein TraF n=1 Tax=Helicobacter sp. 10-6591 TaxID=2004998 RepID=UPI00215BC9B8|nr:conjugal transfer protein TraF [Helicobacter sp. 10-6591]
MKTSKFILSILVASTSLNALEFGSMGNTSAGMGGAGVALKNSAWGLYYNPALLSTSPKMKLGYTVNLGLQEKNIAQMATIDVKNMQNTAKNLADTFGSVANNASAGGLVSALSSALNSITNGNQAAGGAVGGMALSANVVSAQQAAQGGNQQIDLADLQKKLENYLKTSNGNHNVLIDQVKQEINKNNSLNSMQKDLLNGVIGGVNFDSLKFDGSQQQNVQNAISSITISKGSDKGLDKSMSDLRLVYDSLKDNHLNVVSQNGIVFQLGSKKLNNSFGTMAVGYFLSAYSNVSFKANADRMRLILDAGGSYYELDIGGGNYTYRLSSEDDYNRYSLLVALQETDPNKGHNIYLTAFVLNEIPVGYSRTFYLRNSNINVGIAGKFMSASSTQNKIAITTHTNFSKELKTITSNFKRLQSDKAFGLDVGLVYEIDLPKFRNLTFGLVAKNLNSPTFKSTYEDIVIRPQVRLGTAYYTTSGFNIALDVDVTQNDILGLSTIKQKSQMIGGGVGFLWKGMDIRTGLMKDLLQDNGLILTGGINLLGFLDIALQSSTKFTTIQKFPIPQYFNLHVGGSISW